LLAVVKTVKDATGMGLKEAKDLVDHAPRVVREGLDRATAEYLQHNLIAAGAEAEITTSGGEPEEPSKPPPVPDPLTFSVRLLSAGGNKLAVVKTVKDATGLGLKEAKDLVDQAPKVVREGLDHATADYLMQNLIAAGAEAEITQP